MKRGADKTISGYLVVIGVVIILAALLSAGFLASAFTNGKMSFGIFLVIFIPQAAIGGLYYAMGTVLGYQCDQNDRIEEIIGMQLAIMNDVAKLSSNSVTTDGATETEKIDAIQRAFEKVHGSERTIATKTYPIARDYGTIFPIVTEMEPEKNANVNTDEDLKKRMGYSEPLPKIMYCQECGAKQSVDAKFCASCGTNLQI